MTERPTRHPGVDACADAWTGAGPEAVVSPVAGWATGPLGAVQAADPESARALAARARAVAEFVATRPASDDRQPGVPGAMSADRRAARPAVLAEVSEWAVSEVSIALAVSKQAARRMLERDLTLVQKLPATLVALEAGLLHAGHLNPMLDRVAIVADDSKRARFERDLLTWIARRAGKRQLTTPAQLSDKARRMGLGRDPKEDADALLAALRARGVWTRPDRRAGMAVLEALLTAPQAQAVLDVLGRYADALDDDPADQRTRGEKMTDVYLDLLLRPGESQLPPVQAQLTLVAGVRTLLGGSQPGEVGGEPVPADMVRALARAFGLLPDPGRTPAPTGDADDQRQAPDRPREPLPVAWDPADRPDEKVPPEQQASFDRWEAELDARALAGVWGGEDDPPPEVQRRWWEQESHWLAQEDHDRDDGRGQANRTLTDHHDGAGTPASPPVPVPASAHGDEGAGPPGGSLPSPASSATATATATAAATAAVPPPGTSRGAAARAAVEQAGLALLGLDQALRRASAAAGRAWLDERDDEQVWQATGGRLDTVGSDLAALHTASAERRAELAALLDRTAGGTLADRPRIAVVDELTGALLALTDARELRRLAHCGAPSCARRPARCDHDLSGCPGLGPPPPTDGYRPGASLDRFVRARDRRCRFPGCRRRVPLGGELDHGAPWPAGDTSAANLTGLCTGDHRGKHQAPGWVHAVAADGTLTVTTPSGLTAVTEPPPF